MPGLDVIVLLTAGLLAALVGGYVTQRLVRSPIAGYVLAGLVAGSYTPGFEADRHVAEQLAGVGLIVLMFGVGLRVKIEDVLAVGHVATPAAIVHGLVVTGIAAFVAVQAGWELSAGLVYGAALSVASTAVLVSVLSGNDRLHTPGGRLAVGWLAVADLCTVLVLVLVPAVFAAAGSHSVPAGVAMALGAFLAGLVVGRAAVGVRAAADAVPMRHAFAVLFFVSLGMLFDPGTLLDDPQMLGATLAIVLIGKPLAAVAIVALFRQPRTVAVAVALALAQIGEVSFLVASVASDYGVLTADATNTLLAAAIASIVLNPVLFRGLGWIDRRLSRRARQSAGPIGAVRTTGGQKAARHLDIDADRRA